MSKIDFAALQQKVREQLTKKAHAAVTNPERQRQAVQKVNEMGRMEPDQNSHEYGTGYVSPDAESDMHDYTKKYPADGSNIDDVEAGSESGEERVARDYDNAYDFDYHDSEFEPYSGHKRPADRAGVPRSPQDAPER